MTYYSQFGEDKIIESYFEKGYIGGCIDVGAADGVHINNTKYFEELGWYCLCIEPIPEFYEKLKNSRLNAINYAVSPINDKLDFNIIYVNGQTGEAGSALNVDEKLIQHLKNMGYSITSETISVESRTLDYCIENYYKHNKIDFISIDTEGTELEVLKSFSIEKWNPKLIVVENNWEDPEIENYLRQFGYKKDKRLQINEFYIKDKIAFKINMGIGSIMISKFLLDQVKNYFSEIYIIPNLELIRDYRNDKKEYYQFIDKFLPLFFSEPPYILTKKMDLDIPVITADFWEIIDTIKKHGINANPSLLNFDFKKYFIAEDRNPIHLKNYIVVCTKARSVVDVEYEKISSDFYELINVLSKKYTIVLIGEQRIDPNLEYNVAFRIMRSIYNDFKKYVKQYIDFTVPEIYNNPDLSLIKRDCNIMAGAEATICLGEGGNFCLSSGVSKKTISFITWPQQINNIHRLFNENDHIKLFDNYVDFKNEINKLL